MKELLEMLRRSRAAARRSAAGFDADCMPTAAARHHGRADGLAQAIDLVVQCMEIEAREYRALAAIHGEEARK